MKKFKNKLIYLCSVYSLNADAELMQFRYERVLKLTALMLTKGLHIYSPIVHNHMVAVKHNLKAGYDFWGLFDRNVLKHCDVVGVMNEGPWQDSVGVTDEVNVALENKKPVYLIDWDGKSFKFGKKITKCQRITTK